MGGLPYDVYTKLYDAVVWPVIRYRASIWGVKTCSCINALHTRAMRFFVGVGKFTPNNVVAGKMAWIPPDIHQWKSVISHWARLCNKPTPRLNKRIAIWEDSNASRSYKTWYFVVKDKLLSYNINTHTDLNSNVSKYNIIKELYDKMMSLYTYRLRACIIKTESISGRCRNKLWNYCKCNTEYKVEHYCKIILALKH